MAFRIVTDQNGREIYVEHDYDNEIVEFIDDLSGDSISLFTQAGIDLGVTGSGEQATLAIGGGHVIDADGLAEIHRMIES